MMTGYSVETVWFWKWLTACETFVSHRTSVRSTVLDAWLEATASACSAPASSAIEDTSHGVLPRPTASNVCRLGPPPRGEWEDAAADQRAQDTHNPQSHADIANRAGRLGLRAGGLGGHHGLVDIRLALRELQARDRLDLVELPIG